MEFPTITAAKMDVANERIDSLMCSLYHTEVLKKFSQEEQNEELLLPSAVCRLPNQKAFLNRMSDNMGIHMQPTKDKNMLLTKKPDPIQSRFHFLELAPSSITLLTEDVKNSNAEICSRRKTNLPNRHNKSCPALATSPGNTNSKQSAGCLPLFNIPPYVPLLGENPSFVHHRRSLPIYQHRQEILDQIGNQNVVVINGDAGCGKTTQVPQYIVEKAYESKAPCRIVCVIPRRLSVLAAQDRVTAERGVVGDKIVAFKIGLESRCPTNCPLTFCTTAVFLRTLMDSENCLKFVTHLILDQVHERDRYTDMLVGVIKIRLAENPHLRLILLSTNITPPILANYFEQDKIIRIHSPEHAPVVELYLEDILVITKFLTKKNFMNDAGSVASGRVPPIIKSSSVICDNLLTEAWFKGSDIVFKRLMALIREGKMSVDYQHSQTGITLLMAGAIHGNVEVVKATISSGANPTFRVKGYSPYDMANEFARPEIADLLLTYGQRFIEELGCSINNSPISLFGSTTVPEHAENMSEKPEDLIKRFYSKYSPDHANLELIVEVLGCSESYSQSGTVLVYLPAYSDVIELRDMIAASSSQLKKKLEVHVLHGHLPLKEFNNLYLPVADGRRKVILTTSIAETGINFEDVTCVIDCGLVRDRENDAVMISPRRTQWICKAAAQQRSSHIRRGGLIFNLYPRSRIDGMHDFPVPEITRDSIVDVCLHARLLIPSDMRLSQFFCSLPDGPPTTAVHEAVRVLTSIDAIDSQQKITEVGLRLVDLPVEPRLGKMILVGAALKCLDPILTIVCSLAREDPFIIPASPDERKKALQHKYHMAAENHSDHLALLKAYHLWEKATDEGQKRQVCQENYLSVANMELIFLLRVMLVAELRASGYIKNRSHNDIRCLNGHSEIWTAVKAAVLSGLYPNLAHYSPINGNVVVENQIRSQFHFCSTLLAQEGRNNGLGAVALDGPTSGNGFYSMKNSSRLPNAPLNNPWVMFGEKQRAGQFNILNYCSIITPITALLFAGHATSGIQIVQLDPKEQQELTAYWDVDEEDDDLDDLDEDELIRTCHELGYGDISQELLDHNRSVRAQKERARMRKKFVIIKLDDFVGFIVDDFVAQLIVSCRNKLQLFLVKSIRDPGSLPYTNTEESILRTVLSVLSSEETAMPLQQPCGIGRRPTNVSAESILVTPELKPNDLFPINRYLTYTPPPPGYAYANKLSQTAPLGVPNSNDASTGAKPKGKDRKMKSMSMSQEMNFFSTPLFSSSSSSSGLQDMTRAFPNLSLNQTYHYPPRPSSRTLLSTIQNLSSTQMQSHSAQSHLPLSYTPTVQALPFSSLAQKGRPIFKSHDGEYSQGN